MLKRYFLILFTTFLFSPVFSQGNTDFEISKNLDIYSAVFKQLYLHYAEDFEVGDLNKRAIDAMLYSLDPYTNYYPEADIEDVRYLRTGKYGGVGAAIHAQNDTIIVGSVLENYPFYNAGIRPGDKLLAADGLSLVGKTTAEMSEILKGNAGSTLKLEILKSRSNQVIKKEIQRAEIKILNVPFYGMPDDGIAYIKLSQFTETASQEVENALNEMSKKQSIKGLILDLRNNGGGLLIQAVQIMDLFLPPGQLIVETKGKIQSENQRYETRTIAKYPDVPIVVLINGHSASASEILAGSMQDYDRGVILGQKSYGKGLVQKVYPLSFNAQMKITVAKYYIPSGRCIQEINYGSHDTNGKAIRIADSLRGEFKTKAGRTVKDAGGILPDVKIDKELFAPVVFDLAGKQLIFNFSTDYVNSHDSIDNPYLFHLNDSDFEFFKAYLNQNNYQFKTSSIEILDQLLKDEIIANSDSMTNEIKRIKALLSNENAAQIDKNKEAIMNLLEQEIVSRYYFDYGKIKKGLNADTDVNAAMELLLNITEYSKILNP